MVMIKKQFFYLCLNSAVFSITSIDIHIVRIMRILLRNVVFSYS